MIATKSVTVNKLIKINSISVSTYNVYAVGKHKIPISYNPYNYSV
nr:MAG TPA: hypothetical protein [Caudoviricetes sp.]